MKIRIFIALLLCRLTRWLLRLFRRGGTTLPGRVALWVCPGLLGHLAKGVLCVVITGTNGKTTTARIVEQAVKASGLSCFSNRSGANLITGITTGFAMNSTLTGRPLRGYAVIECDEAASKAVCKQINPAVLLVTNVFRDQLDRYGEITHTLESIRQGVMNSPRAILCLNADCSLTASIAGDARNQVVFFGVNTRIYDSLTAEVSDAPRCFYCQSEYQYHYRTYAHLGGFYCPGCGYQRQEPEISVTQVLRQTADNTTVEMDVRGEKRLLTIDLPGGYNIYNAVGAVAAVTAMGLPLDAAAGAVESFECGFGRMEKFQLEGVFVRMILVKNPAGCNQVLNFLSALEEGESLFVVCLNDKVADGTDVSWIWDADFEKLAAMGDRISHTYVSGTRADDMALRLKYAGLPEERVTAIRDYGDLISRIVSQDKPVYIMPTYTAMLDLREKISSAYGYKDFWE